MKLPDIRTVNVYNKRVFLRADLDVSLSEDGQILDDMRLQSSRETISYLLDRGAKVIIAGHLDRPGGKVVPELSLEPVAAWFAERFKIYDLRFKKIGELAGWEIGEKLFLLENLRFYKGEEDPPAGGDPVFANSLSRLADLYVNDAFAVSHRDHCSIVGVAGLLSHYAGIRLQKEVEVLGSVLSNPKRPLVVVIGGKKIETKLPLVKKMLKIADSVLVGGKLAQEVDEFLKVHRDELGQHMEKLSVAGQNEEKTDITKEAAQQFIDVIHTAQTVVWNGPLGIFEQGHTYGTEMVAKAIAQSSSYKVVGGGDTVEYIRKIGLFDKFDFVSTGGGAMLAFLSGEKLPGLEALTI